MSDPGRAAYLAFISDAGLDDDWDGVSQSMRHAWAMVESDLRTPCEAKLANIERALELQAQTIEAMRQGLNVIGAQFNQITETVGGFAARFSSMGPASMMKAMMGRGKSDGD